jgi:hypothetical protein
MQLQKAERKQAKIKLGLQGPSGSGKTMGALIIAFGLCGDWSKIAVIDTENYSASLYAHLGGYNVLSITAPFTPEKYTEAIKVCEENGMEVIIVDSISHEWEGNGGVLNIHSEMAGNSFTNWNRLTPRHNAFVQAMLQSTCHIIGTIRTKQDYVLSERNGKQVPEKVGLKGITREGMDYEFTIVLDLDMKNNARVSKDRTSLFAGKPDFRISVEIGMMILKWCHGNTLSKEEVLKRIREAKTINDLLALYKDSPIYQVELFNEFTQRRKELETLLNPSLNNKFSTNGINANHQ